MTGLRGRGAMYDATGAEMDDFALKVADLNTRFSGAALMQVQPVQVKFGAPFTVQQVKKLASGVDHSYAVLGTFAPLPWLPRVPFMIAVCVTQRMGV